MNFISFGRAAPVLSRFGKVLALLLLATQPVFAVDPTAVSRAGVDAVIGGAAITTGKPWVAALIRNSSNPDSKTSSRQFCGGALVNPNWVVTAAHCVTNVKVDSFKVLLGATDLDGNGGELLEVAEVILNQYWEQLRHNDIAMLRLKTPAKEEWIALATTATDASLINSVVKVYGWGYSSHIVSSGCKVRFLESVTNQDDYSCSTETFSAGDKPKTMMEASIRIASYADCQARFADFEKSVNVTNYASDYFSSKRSPDILCGWDDTDQQTPCYGDSGGPVVTIVNNFPFLVGVVNSRLTPDCVAKLDVESFARISYYSPFIFDAMFRNQAYGFDSFCPQSQSVELIYIPLGGTSVSTTAQWKKDNYATSYRLYYAVADSLGQNISYLDQPASATGFSITLTSGQRFHIAVQGRGAYCDGPVSSMKEVVVP